MIFKYVSPQVVRARKNEIITLLKGTGRDGIENVLDFLERTNFYWTKSSDNRHHNWSGGLAQHSLGVYRQMSAMNAKLATPYPEDTVVIVAILHDLCKAYIRMSAQTSMPLDPEVYGHLNHKHVLSNHGSLSAALVRYQCRLTISDEEYGAINGHMHGSEIAPLQQLVHDADRADCMATEQEEEARLSSLR